MNLTHKSFGYGLVCAVAITSLAMMPSLVTAASHPPVLALYVTSSNNNGYPLDEEGLNTPQSSQNDYPLDEEGLNSPSQTPQSSQSVPAASSPFQNYNISPSGNSATLSTVIQLIAAYMNAILVLLMGLAMVMFVWYIIQYFIKPDADRKEAGQYVLYSVIGFFVILCIWGIVAILTNTFGLGNVNSQSQTWSSFANIFPHS